MPGKSLRVSSALPLDLEISIGQAQWGQYTFYLWDPAGSTHQIIGRGLNADNVPDVFQVIRPGTGYNGWMISWEVNIAAYSSSPGQRYAVTVAFSQGGSPLVDGIIHDSGELPGGAKALMDFVRLAEV